MANVSRAVVGAQSPEVAQHILLEALNDSFRQQAGFIPSIADEPLPEAVQHRVGLLPLHWPETGFMTTNMRHLMHRLRGRAWICGSAALELVIGTNSWSANDTDVFAVDKAAYGDIMQQAYEVYEQRPFSALIGITFTVPFEQADLTASINLVCPPEGTRWDDVGSVLAGFDLSCCAVGLVDDHFAAALYPEDIEQRVFRYIQTQFPLRTIVRIGKYIARGFQPDPTFYADLWRDPRMVPVLNMLSDFNAAACHQDIMRAIGWHQPSDGNADSWQDEEEFDGWGGYD